MGDRVVLGSTSIMSKRTYTQVALEARMWAFGYNDIIARWYHPSIPGKSWLDSPSRPYVTVFVDDETGVLTVDVAKYEASLRES